MMKRIRFAIALILLILPLSGCSQERGFTQPNSAMEPTILEGETFAADMKAYQNSLRVRGDVIIFRHKDILIVKRVIAIPGDIIEGRDFLIILNGTPAHEDYVQHIGKNSISQPFSFLRSFGPTKISAGQFFVMGDNRDFSEDSRDPSFGTIATADVAGKAIRIVKSNKAERKASAIH